MRLSASQRKNLPISDFAVPSKAPGPGSFPIPDKNHAKAALSLERFATPSQRATVAAKANKKLRRKKRKVKRHS